ncbi:MAG: hypothetical protein IIT42_03355 [Clostridia bacterium]|nr:hypothetical protein [Clostridia bacterium]
MEYNKQTWDTTSYVNPTRMNHIEDGIEANSLLLDEVYELNLINGWSGQIFVTVNRNGRITCLSGALLVTGNVSSPIFARADTVPQNCITNKSVPVATQGGAIYSSVGSTDVIGFGQDANGWYATLNSQDHNVAFNSIYGRA